MKERKEICAVKSDNRLQNSEKKKKKNEKDGKYYAVDVRVLYPFFGRQVVAVVKGSIVLSLWASTHLHREVGLRKGEDLEEGVFAGIVMDVGGLKGRLMLWWEEKKTEEL